jgi:hypothetical protein
MGTERHKPTILPVGGSEVPTLAPRTDPAQPSAEPAEIVANLRWRAKKVVRFYNRRGKAEQWINEGKNTVKSTKLSCRRVRDNAARLQLFALAYKLANFQRQLVLPKPIQRWTLTTLREKLVKIGSKVVGRARYVTFQLSEVAVPRQLFARILERFDQLRLACASG